MCLGLPASGKSTWARRVVSEKGYKRVNKDDLRAMLDNNIFSKNNEDFTIAVRDYIVEQALSKNHTIIIDDTNLAVKHEERLREIAAEYSADFEIKDFTHVSLEVCIKRDAERKDSVGEQVIQKMHQQFFMGEYLKKRHIKTTYVQKYIPLPSKPDAIIVDIDGTLAHMTTRKGRPYDWHRVSEDEVDETVAEIVRTYKEEGVRILIMSGRDEVCRKQTEKWLEENDIPYDELFMRKKNDSRKDNIVKMELFDNNVRNNYNVLFVLDDRKQVVKAWRSLGLKCLQVEEGNF